MEDCKLVKVPIPIGERLSTDQCPKTQEETNYMVHVPHENVVGSLLYAIICTRLYITHEMGVLRILLSKTVKEHWTIVKRVFTYLHGMNFFSIYYHENPEEVGVHGFVDSDLDGDIDGRWTTSGYVLILFRVVVN